jgi:hypothetical protein
MSGAETAMHLSSAVKNWSSVVMIVEQAELRA